MDKRQVASNKKDPLQFCRSASLIQDKKRPAPVVLVSGVYTQSSGFRNLMRDCANYALRPLRQHMPCEATTSAG
jgi:hypothetical protein